ncbi:MAG: SPASM domain-containing protein, partial [Ignisphaera sp.]|nr:SPASM domain-containing protein [Ignisphaera sp.]
LCILYDGTVTPCNMFNPYPYGNIKSQSLEQIWNGDRRLAFIDNHKYDTYCRNCAYITKG